MAVNPLFFGYDFLQVFQNVENRENMRLQFRYIRDTSNPFELPDEKFLKLFRLNKQATLNLIEELSELVDEPTRRDTVPFHLRVFASLLFFSSGSYQTNIGEDLNIGLSQSAMSRVINEVSNLISTYLLPRYVLFPTSEMEIRNVKEAFQNANLIFSNVIGTIDCTHVAIVSPKTDDPIHPAIAYINRKGFHSINVQAIFDSNLMIRNVNAQYPGAAHDAAIWNVSRIQHHMRRKYNEGRRNCYLLGDSGYPIQPWMLTPIPSPQPNSPEERYNIAHRRARNVVERGFGVLKGRFRCLRKDRVLHYSHIIAARIICSCAVLHNICRQHNMPDVENDDQNHNIDNAVENDLDLMDGIDDDLIEGRFVRSRVIQEMFE